MPSAIFLTHAHIGHYTGLMYLGKEVINAAAVPLYATPAMHAFLASNAPWRALVENNNVAPLSNDGVVDLGDGLAVTALQVPHRNEYADTGALGGGGCGTPVLLTSPSKSDGWRCYASCGVVCAYV